MSTGQIGQLILTKDNPSTLEHSARTAVAAVVSLLVARLFRLPEAYWASISTLIVMQSTLGAALPISAQRFAGTAMGVIVGGFAAALDSGGFLLQPAVKARGRRIRTDKKVRNFMGKGVVELN